jgi:hypothetical protein
MKSLTSLVAILLLSACSSDTAPAVDLASQNQCFELSRALDLTATLDDHNCILENKKYGFTWDIKYSQLDGMIRLLEVQIELKRMPQVAACQAKCPSKKKVGPQNYLFCVSNCTKS